MLDLAGNGGVQHCSNNARQVVALLGSKKFQGLLIFLARGTASLFSLSSEALSDKYCDLGGKILCIAPIVVVFKFLDFLLGRRVVQQPAFEVAQH